MTRRLRLAARLSLSLALAISLSATAQNRRRAINPVNEITILQTTDVHDHANGAGPVGLDVDPVTGMSTVGAYARMAAYINSVRSSATHPVVLVDSGDWTMGTIYDLTLGSRPLALYFLTAMRYDVVTLGNHEFDYSPKGLATMLAAAKSAFNFQTPIVASNMNLNGNADLAPYFGAGKQIQPTYVETLVNGTKIGFIGLMGEDAAIDAPASAPVSFTPLSASYAAIQTLVNDLRNNQGAQIVIALSHSGTDASGTTGEDVKLAQHVRGIDVIASGHTHTPLASAHAVKNEGWTTEVIDAGAFGTNVARLDLRITPGATTLLAYNNVPMTGSQTDATMAGVVNATDKQLNAQLGPVLSQFFSDYDAANLGKGIYHPAGATAQTLVPNDQNPVLAPNGLGDLAADAVRNAPNAIIAQTLAGVGGIPANLPGYDFTPVQLAVVGTGVIRSSLPAGVPLSFADIYNVLPLGISPDTSQALPIGYPLISSYIDVADLKKIAALQLVGMSNLIGSSFYLNLSGIQYTLKAAELDTYFKYATAAAVLDITTKKAAAGSTAALQTFGALFNLGTDQGASLMALYNAKNPYAVAMVSLNNANPTQAQIDANLKAIGDVGGAAIYGTSAVASLVVAKAVDAIGTVSGFAATDLTNTGSTTELTGRVRAVADLYAILLLNAVQSQYGIAITPYQSATGSTVLSPADFPTLLNNRIDAAPATAGIQELKEWMALMQNVGVGLHGQIGPDYASTTNFSQFPTFGAAVKTRNASYPLAGIAQLVTTAAGLSQAP
ncbi:MAG TPA: metallophosphoesterase [Thermoanaerobaculia bacterium]|nr:metallophosphoesterase [Thermoanaerobaculia bacterium]